MKKYWLIMLVNLVFALLALPKTQAYWTSPLPSEAVCSSYVKIGNWKIYIVLEEVGRIDDPKAGLEFLYKDCLYVVIWDLDESIPDDEKWWGGNNRWSGDNVLSEDWVSTNYYDQRSMPIKKDGLYYLALHSGSTNQVPGNHYSWFEISEWFLPGNVYLKGYIVKHGFDSEGNPRYWVARQYVNPGHTPGVYAWAWDEIPEWRESAEEGETVYSFDENGEIRFWKALRDCEVAPSEETAGEGYFQEIKNGSVSPIREEIVNFWLGHNHYSSGEVVIYGMLNSRRYRYFRAKRPSVGVVPFRIENGEEVINKEYWEEI